MNIKKLFLILVPSSVIIIAGAYFLINHNQKIDTTSNTTNNNNSAPASPVATPAAKTVPLPTAEDIIRTFISLINEHRVVEAVGMLDSSTIGDDSSKQAWGVQFNSFQSLTLLNISKSGTEGNEETYEVTLDAKMKPESANAVMPYYGFDNGENIRWIVVVKDKDNLYKIRGIATGP